MKKHLVCLSFLCLGTANELVASSESQIAAKQRELEARRRHLAEQKKHTAQLERENAFSREQEAAHLDVTRQHRALGWEEVDLQKAELDETSQQRQMQLQARLRGYSSGLAQETQETSMALQRTVQDAQAQRDEEKRRIERLIANLGEYESMTEEQRRQLLEYQEALRRLLAQRLTIPDASPPRPQLDRLGAAAANGLNTTPPRIHSPTSGNAEVDFTTPPHQTMPRTLHAAGTSTDNDDTLPRASTSTDTSLHTLRIQIESDMLARDHYFAELLRRDTEERAERLRRDEAERTERRRREEEDRFIREEEWRSRFGESLRSNSRSGSLPTTVAAATMTEASEQKIKDSIGINTSPSPLRRLLDLSSIAPDSDDSAPPTPQQHTARPGVGQQNAETQRITTQLDRAIRSLTLNKHLMDEILQLMQDLKNRDFQLFGDYLKKILHRLKDLSDHTVDVSIFMSDFVRHLFLIVTSNFTIPELINLLSKINKLSALDTQALGAKLTSPMPVVTRSQSTQSSRLIKPYSSGHPDRPRLDSYVKRTAQSPEDLKKREAGWQSPSARNDTSDRLSTSTDTSSTTAAGLSSRDISRPLPPPSTSNRYYPGYPKK